MNNIIKCNKCSTQTLTTDREKGVVFNLNVLCVGSEERLPVAPIGVAQAGVVLYDHITITDLFQRMQTQILQVGNIQCSKTDSTAILGRKTEKVLGRNTLLRDTLYILFIFE